MLRCFSFNLLLVCFSQSYFFGFVQETRDKVKAGYHMPPPADTPPPVCQIMKDCWNFDPEARPRFSEILRRLKQI